MEIFKSLYQKAFSVRDEDFETLAIELFHFQYEHNFVYQSYVNYLTVNPKKVTKLTQIPFLPIEFFKRHKVKTGSWNEDRVFESSGTTGQLTSKHYVYDSNYYLENCRIQFQRFYGDLKDYTVLALLPSYLERADSSLVLMAQDFIERSGDSRSGFFLDNLNELAAILRALSYERKPTLLLGVTFGLLDLADEVRLDLGNVIVMETGGMKGRREEMVRPEVHAVLTKAFSSDRIHSEYGMTELFSQAYSRGWGVFEQAGSIRVFTRDINDPLLVSNELKSGGLNVIDLANVHSCCFIETMDIGKVHVNGTFEVLGRMDNSDIRGCNLMLA